MRVGIINVTGYIGVEMARLLHQHPEVELVSVTGRSAAGKRLDEVFPHFAGTDYRIETALDSRLDLAFSAMPHKTAVEVVPPLLEQGLKVIDASADFRLKNPSEYPRWYGFTHPSPGLLQDAVYGLPELRAQEIRDASLVANPGCYSTSVILALAPAVKHGIIRPDIVADSKSGVSGAGRTASLTTQYAEANESTAAYALDGHRHLSEMEQELGLLNPADTPSITFVPHLTPMTRGILSTCYAPLRDSSVSRESLRELYREFYRGAPCVRVVDTPPQTKHTWGSNLCLIYPTIDVGTNRLIVIGCIDNLVKGGAGQAIQNMNLMFGLPETTGLEALPVMP